jgi:hypothetical protein
MNVVEVPGINVIAAKTRSNYEKSQQPIFCF